MPRVETGIKGFDELVEGGFPRLSTTLISGTPGTGKTIFGLEFLYHGATKFNENALFLSFEQSAEELREQAKEMGMDFEKAEKEGKLFIIHTPASKPDLNLFKNVSKLIEEKNIKRLVVDSLAVLGVTVLFYGVPLGIKKMDLQQMEYLAGSAKDPSEAALFRASGSKTEHFIYLFLEMIKEWGVTALVITDAPEGGNYLTRDTVSEFACDGVVLLKRSSMGEKVNRTIEVMKMRKTKVADGPHEFDFTDKGIKLE